MFVLFICTTISIGVLIGAIQAFLRFGRDSQARIMALLAMLVFSALTFYAKHPSIKALAIGGLVSSFQLYRRASPAARKQELVGAFMKHPIQTVVFLLGMGPGGMRSEYVMELPQLLEPLNKSLAARLSPSVLAGMEALISESGQMSSLFREIWNARGDLHPIIERVKQAITTNYIPKRVLALVGVTGISIVFGYVVFILFVLIAVMR